MTWEQKLAALQAIADTSLRMRKPGDWYVDAEGRHVGGDGFLSGSYGNGSTPAEAVQNDWRQLVEELKAPLYVVVERGEVRKQYRWNEFMWVEVPLNCKAS